MFCVQMFGGFAIRAEGAFVHQEIGASEGQLAAYLFAFPNKVHRRELLADRFWGDNDGTHARHAFNTALWRLRRFYQDLMLNSEFRLKSTSREVILETDDPEIVDVHRFQKMVAQCSAQKQDKISLSQLSEAISIYDGPFLEGEDHVWVLTERERLHCLYVRTLIDLMRLYAKDGHYEDALDCGRQILNIDPLRESIQRSIILLYVLNGQRPEALCQFDRCQQLLRVECDVDPAPETTQLNSLIRSGAIFNQLDKLHIRFFCDVNHVPISPSIC